jgi:hypothetical protein
MARSKNKRHPSGMKPKDFLMPEHKLHNCSWRAKWDEVKENRKKDKQKNKLLKQES